MCLCHSLVLLRKILVGVRDSQMFRSRMNSRARLQWPMKGDKVWLIISMRFLVGIWQWVWVGCLVQRLQLRSMREWLSRCNSSSQLNRPPSLSTIIINSPYSLAPFKPNHLSRIKTSPQPTRSSKSCLLSRTAIQIPRSKTKVPQYPPLTPLKASISSPQCFNPSSSTYTWRVWTRNSKHCKTT